jgi:hypothetical protein
VAALAACNTSTDLPPSRPFALFNLEPMRDAARPSGYTARAFASFINERVTGVISSENPGDVCSLPSGSAIIGGRLPNYINPGQPLQLRLQGAAGSADPSTRTVPLTEQRLGEQLNIVQWQNDSLPTYYPGSDTVIFTSPGVAGGFPAFTIKDKGVSPFTAQRVADSASSGGITAAWTAAPAGEAGTTMQILLRYQSTPAASTLDRQVVCVARDDGTFTIPGLYLEEWHTAGEDNSNRQKEVAYTRFKTRQANIGDAIAVMLTTYDTTIAVP